jgi:titin
MYEPSVESAFSISPSVAGHFTWNAEGTQMTFTPSAPLQEVTTYTLTLAATSTDVGRNQMAAPVSYAFTTVTNPPAAPLYLGAYAVSPTQINLAWWDASSNETGFKIERKTGATGTWAQIATVGANVTSYANTGLTANTQYYYRACAYNAGGDSAFSNEANATTGALPAPSSLIASAKSTSQITLNWTDNSTNETGFKIERKTGATGTYALIATVGANVVTYSNTGLTVNTTYYYRIYAYNATGNSVYSNIANATPASLPAPSNLRLTAVSNTQINLTWWDNSTTEIRFKIERKTGSAGTWAQIATVGANITSYSNTGLAGATTYYYRVRASAGIANSLYSNEPYATTYAVAAPTNLVASIASTTSATLTWTDNATNETGFKIERKTGITGAYAQIATVGANILTYTDTGLAGYTDYYYRVRAYNGSGNSTYSNEAGIVPAIGTPRYLGTWVVSLTQINLAWWDAASNETGFKIERKTGSTGAWAQIATVGANVTSYANTGLTAATTYYYRVRAYNASGNSAYSNEAYATTYALNAPTSLAASIATATSARLTWVDNATNETGFSIERKTGITGTYAQIATVGANVVTYTNTGLTGYTDYYYRVRAYNASGNSTYSNEVGIAPAIGTPRYLGAYAVSPTQINLAWWDAASNETGFKIERKTGSTGTWTQIATVGANVVSYTNTGLTATTAYYYRVRAYNASGNSAYSNEAAATTYALLTPTGLNAAAASSTQINLSWSDTNTAETGFKIERKTGATGAYAQIATTGANVTTYSNTGLTAATIYYYRVRAYNGSGNSNYSNEANATTP